MKKKDLVSIIITSKNEEDVIGDLLESINEQTYPNIETIIVDNKSDDNTQKIVKQYQVRLFQFGPERSAQRNYGATKSKGEYLLFLDADMILSKNVIKECVSKISSNSNAAAVIIPEVSIAKTYWEKVKAFERSFYNLEGDSEIEAARFFKKEFFNKVGGYDTKITGPEDWDLSETIIKKGYKPARIKSVIFHRERIKSLFQIAEKKYYYGLKTDRYLKKQKIPLISPKTIYFLRPVFYRNWNKFLVNSQLTIGLFIILAVELIAGGIGYLRGRFRNE